MQDEILTIDSLEELEDRFAPSAYLGAGGVVFLGLQEVQ